MRCRTIDGFSSSNQNARAAALKDYGLRRFCNPALLCFCNSALLQSSASAILRLCNSAAPRLRDSACRLHAAEIRRFQFSTQQSRGNALLRRCAAATNAACQHFSDSATSATLRVCRLALLQFFSPAKLQLCNAALLQTCASVSPCFYDPALPPLQHCRNTTLLLQHYRISGNRARPLKPISVCDGAGALAELFARASSHFSTTLCADMPSAQVLRSIAAQAARQLQSSSVHCGCSVSRSACPVISIVQKRSSWRFAHA